MSLVAWKKTGFTMQLDLSTVPAFKIQAFICSKSIYTIIALVVVFLKYTKDFPLLSQFSFEITHLFLLTFCRHSENEVIWRMCSKVVNQSINQSVEIITRLGLLRGCMALMVLMVCHEVSAVYPRECTLTCT